MDKILLKNFRLIIKYNLGKIILFELLHKAFALMFIFPSVKYMINIAMKKSEMVYLILSNVYKLFMNPTSILLVIGSGLIIIFYILFEFIFTVVCIDESIKGEDRKLVYLIKLSINRLIKIMSPKNIFLIIFILLIIPVTGLIVNSSLINKVKIPDYILDYINTNYVLSILYLILIIVLGVVLIKWIFSLHELSLNTNIFKEARKRSAYITKKRVFKILIYFIVLFALLNIIEVLLYNGCNILIALYTKYISSVSTKEIFIGKSITLKDYTLFISSIVLFISTIVLISSMYYRYNNIEIQRGNFKKRKISLKKRALIVVVSLIALMVESSAFSYNTGMYNLSFTYNTTSTAHRSGSTLAPENTLASLKMAIESKAEYAEIDVQETKDGELVLTHDSNLKRTAGVNKNIWEVTYDELKDYDVGKHFSESFEGEKIPTLNEFIKQSKGKIKLVIEIKTNGHEKDDIVKKVIDTIEKNKITDQCMIASLDNKVLERVKKENPNIVTCYLATIAYGDFYNWDYVDVYAIESTFVNKNLVYSIHEMGKQVFVWTLNNEKEIEKMLDFNVDSIITDNPYLVYYSIYNKKNSLTKRIADYFFD